MKKVLKVGLAVGSLAFFFTFFGCSNQIEEKQDYLGYLSLLNQSTSCSTGTISAFSADSESRALDVNDICYASAYVSGTGIDTGKEPSSALADVANGKASNISIQKVPLGKNRIVSIQAYDLTKAKLGTVTMRNICDVGTGVNSVVVNWSTTALGNVFYSLNERGFDVSKLTSSDIQNVKNVISAANVHASLFNSEALARKIVENQGTASIDGSYVMETAELKFATALEGAYTVQVCDPLSESKAFSTASGSVTGIAPGTWKVYIIQNGKTVKTTTVTFESGKTKDIGTLGVITDKIIFHVEKYKTIWAWNPDTSENFTGGKWPGTAMEPDARENWYSFELPVEATMVIFSNQGGGQTPDLKIPGAGEWWYTGGKFYDEDPIDYENPVLESFTCDSSAPSLSGDVVFEISATDNKKLAKVNLKLDGKTLASAVLAGTSDTVTYKWNSAVVKNGSHTISAVVLDGSGNESEERTISFTTQNENIKPVAVINGSANVGLGKEKIYRAKSSYDPNGTIVSYRWTVSGATIVKGQETSEITVKFPDSTSNCSISLEVTDDDGATDTAVKEVICQEGKATDFREETIYFAMTTRFYDGDKSNNVHCWDENPKTPEDDPAWRGDFKGLIEKLDYIKALGFSAIWITPVVENASGLDYHGYHAMNFSKVDPRYESSDVKFQDLIDAVHSKGMKLVLDVVFNHTGNFGEANLAPMFEKDYSADLSDINASMKLSADSLLDESYFGLPGALQYQTRLAKMKNTDGVNHDKRNFYHHYANYSWDDFTCQWGQIAGDCVDLNTENPAVLEYIVKAYSQYIAMGVDAFRVDTVKHIPRLSFNKYLNEAFMDAAAASGNDNFYMFGEVCARANEVVYRGTPNMSAYFYTWKEDQEYEWSNDTTLWDDKEIFETDYPQMPFTAGEITFDVVNAKSAHKQGLEYAQHSTKWTQRSDNHLLRGNEYHDPDHSMKSGLDVIDFPMHWNFDSASGAFSVHGEDWRYNDATYNVVYVDSHDYAPCGDDTHRFHRGTDVWAENLDLMFTFRGIPCLYYGSEIEFMKGAIIDKGPLEALCDTGRAYFGDYLEGEVKATDFSEYTASGKVAETLEYPLAKHLQRLNKIRREIPALQKGQYSTENCTGNNLAFKRRYTKDGVDSFVLVTISGDATFSGLPAGTYVDAVTGDSKTVTEGGSLTTSGCSGQANMRVYVLNGEGKIGDDTEWLK